MGPQVLVGMIVPVAFFTAVFGIFYLRNRENMALIERGINPRNIVKDVVPKVSSYLKYGYLLLGSGCGLLLAYLLDVLIQSIERHNLYVMGKLDADNYYIHDNPAIYFALIAIGGGIGLVRAYKTDQKIWKEVMLSKTWESNDKSIML